MSDTPKGMYDTLADELKKIDGIQFAEYAWATRPKTNHGTYQRDFHAESDNGDDSRIDQAVEGSVDTWTKGHCGLIAAAVESALETVCPGSWYLNSMQVETDTGMLHREYVFQMEAD
jgi:hypothetical protein